MRERARHRWKAPVRPATSTVQAEQSQIQLKPGNSAIYKFLFVGFVFASVIQLTMQQVRFEPFHRFSYNLILVGR